MTQYSVNLPQSCLRLFNVEKTRLIWPAVYYVSIPSLPRNDDMAWHSLRQMQIDIFAASLLEMTKDKHCPRADPSLPHPLSVCLAMVCSSSRVLVIVVVPYQDNIWVEYNDLETASLPIPVVIGRSK